MDGERKAVYWPDIAIACLVLAWHILRWLHLLQMALRDSTWWSAFPNEIGMVLFCIPIAGILLGKRWGFWATAVAWTGRLLFSIGLDWYVTHGPRTSVNVVLSRGVHYFGHWLWDGLVLALVAYCVLRLRHRPPCLGPRPASPPAPDLSIKPGAAKDKGCDACDPPSAQYGG